MKEIIPGTEKPIPRVSKVFNLGGQLTTATLLIQHNS